MLSRVLSSARRRVLAHRRPLATVLAAVAVATGVHAATTPTAPTERVLTAARDLPAGTVLRDEDLAVAAWAPGTAPAGSTDAAEVVGQALAAPLRAGEPVTDVRLVGPDLAIDADETALPVRFADAAAVALLDPGDRIDLVATDPQGGGSHVVTADVTVLAVPPPDEAAASTQPGALVVLGVPAVAVTRVSDAAVRYFLGYAFRH